MNHTREVSMPETPEESIQKHYRLERVLGRQCYLLLCARGPVTIRSQQVRAMVRVSR